MLGYVILDDDTGDGADLDAAECDGCADVETAQGALEEYDGLALGFKELPTAEGENPDNQQQKGADDESAD